MQMASFPSAITLCNQYLLQNEKNQANKLTISSFRLFFGIFSFNQ